MESQKTNSKKVWSIIGNVFIWLFILFAVVVTILAFASQSSEDGVPAIGGRAILTVQTPSMEPTFKVGDIIIGRKLTTEEQKALKVDDIITYDAGDLDGDGRRDLNSHRIIEVKNENGIVTYITKGDNNKLEDATPVRAENVICQYTGTRLKGVGKVLDFLQQPTGFLVAVVLPLVAFFIFELISFIRKFLQVKNAGKKQISAADEELIKQKAIEEYLRQQQAQKEAEAQNAAPAEESAKAETPAEEPAKTENTEN